VQIAADAGAVQMLDTDIGVCALMDADAGCVLT